MSPTPRSAPQPRDWPAVVAVAGLLVILFGIGAVVMGLTFGAQFGDVQLPLLALLAAIPLCIVLPVFLWLDSFEREPGWLLALALAWGAVVATGFALIVNDVAYALAAMMGLPADAVTAVIVAPLVEESLKGAFLLGLWWFRPRQLNGVVDGVVYAGVVAAGFAFVENILYFAAALGEMGTSGLTATFIMRGLPSPFAHPLFTVCIGAAIGRATLARSGGWRFALPVLGWCLAVLLHGIWNLSVVLQAGWLLLYLLFEVPVFIGFIVFVVWVRRHELRHVSRHLEVYVRNGWLTGFEARMVGHAPERRRAAEWAQTAAGRDGRQAMREFQRVTTRLAHLRARLDRRHRSHGPVEWRPAPAWEVREVAQQQELLDRLPALRERFAGVQQPRN
ncbi:PrsW family intramembrane metalloprotease [Kytococcus sedentarius]|uniref:PrsW family intramembrane metalloprotease n=1 Tax=Kytococcus sedentarius TaxID=1276 RepID=UPI0035BBAF6A